MPRRTDMSTLQRGRGYQRLYSGMVIGKVRVVEVDVHQQRLRRAPGREERIDMLEHNLERHCEAAGGRERGIPTMWFDARVISEICTVEANPELRASPRLVLP